MIMTLLFTTILNPRSGSVSSGRLHLIFGKCASRRAASVLHGRSWLVLGLPRSSLGLFQAVSSHPRRTNNDNSECYFVAGAQEKQLTTRILKHVHHVGPRLHQPPQPPKSLFYESPSDYDSSINRALFGKCSTLPNTPRGDRHQ